MRKIARKAKGRMPGENRGFTLIELLVVIGIIVALAAITVPLVTKFAGKGDEGALKAETETIQSAMKPMTASSGLRPLGVPRLASIPPISKL